MYGALIAFSVVFLYQVRSVLSPFVYAGVMAYLLNPLVTWLNTRFKIPRGLAVGLIYILVIIVTVFTISIVGTRLIKESEQFHLDSNTIVAGLRQQINVLPDWAQDTATTLLDAFNENAQVTTRRLVPMFSGALGRSVNVLIFFLAMFYFLKDGRKMVDDVTKRVPKRYQDNIAELLGRINGVLGNYLRGQLILVAIMSALTYLALLILGLPYALALGVFTGFAEVIPYVGPIIAAGLAVFVASTDRVLSFGLTPFTEILVVIIVYTILRQVEDLFIVPQVMGRLTKLHPLVVLASVLVGAHLFGAIGLIVAVPLAATGRVILAFILEKIG